MKKWLAKIMVGRYGVDQLTNFMLIFSMALLLIGVFLPGSIAGSVLTGIAFGLLILGYSRVFSKKTGVRYQENQKFLRLRNRVTGRFRGFFDRLRQSKTHRFYKCPQCGVTVRVPRGKGKIKITCPKCRNPFIKST